MQSSCGSLPRYAASSFVEQTTPVAFGLSDSASQVLEVNFTDPIRWRGLWIFDGVTEASRRDLLGALFRTRVTLVLSLESFF